MALVADVGDSSQPNDPKAIRMAFIAFLIFNVIVGSIFGSPGVLLKPMAERLGASIEMVSAGSLAVIVSSAVFAPMVGALATKVSLRTLLVLASLLLSSAWFVLAFTHSYLAYLGAYLLLLGPAMAIGSSVLPLTLITRWFAQHRGMAIGIVHLPIIVAAMPLAAAWTISHFRLQSTFFALAALPLVVLLPASLFIIDRPPGQQEQVDAMIASGTKHALSIPQLLVQPAFWALCLSVGVANTSSTALGVHLVSMAESWGVEHMHAAGLASIMSLVGMAGSVLFGIVADRIGGALSLMVIALGEAILWALFLAGLPYAGLAAVIGLIGLFGAGAVPAMSKAFGDTFGRESFSRAIGLLVPVTLPLMFVGMVGPGRVVRLTGSYNGVVIGAVVAFGVAALLAFSASRIKRVVESNG
jgi:cyanate permease